MSAGKNKSAPWRSLDEMRCDVTTNLCGTDTWAEGYVCECDSCQGWLKARQAMFDFPGRRYVRE